VRDSASRTYEASASRSAGKGSRSSARRSLLDAEQEQSTMLWELLQAAHVDLVEAHEEIAKAYGDPPLPG
jgi:hypothetical protein